MDKTQKIEVWEYMKSHGSITSWEAFEYLGVSRLSGRIYDLRQDGCVIDQEHLTKKNRHGKKVSYDRFYISDCNTRTPSN